MQQYNDPRRVLRQNIFNFDGTIVDMKTFETKTCFDEKEVRYYTSGQLLHFVKLISMGVIFQ